MVLSAAPADDILEVTLIGPSVGECVLIHYCKNWFIVDSCSDRATGLPAALVYLNQFGITADQVKVIACSHWHDDHFKGLGVLYSAYPSAQFWMSGALKANEFISLIESYREWPLGRGSHTSGLKELTACIDQARTSGTSPKFAIHDQRMWLASDGSAELWSLSPSSEMMRKGLLDIAKLLPAPWQSKTAAVQGPNHIAVAMHFKAGAHSVLLGSDLEEHGDPLTGWSAILNSISKPPQLASLFKVGHHGSSTAEHSEVWKKMLIPQPVAILTPFSRSSLPRDTDVARLKNNSSRVFLSTKKALAEVKRTGALSKMVKSKNLKSVDGLSGIIQCRVKATDPNAQWEVALGGLAAEL